MLGLAQDLDAEGVDAADDLPRWRRLVAVALGITLALALGLLLVLAKLAASERDEALGLQRHSYEVIALARAVEGSVARAESLLGRYVVSLDVNDGRRYTEEWRQASIGIETLRRATRGDPVQHRNLAFLRAAYADRGATLDDIALRTTHDQRLGALGRLYAANKGHDAERIGEILRDTINREMALLEQRSRHVDEQELRLDHLSSSYSVVGVVLLVAALGAVWAANSAAGERRFARRLAAAEARRVDDLEIAVRDRTHELEIANARLRTEMEERAQAEQGLRQLHKMEAMGQLTGGIAHDFNNMLAVVMGGLELARRRLSEDIEAAGRHIDNAMEGANRAASLTRRLLAFARAEPLLPGAVDADRLILDMAELLDRTIGDQIQVVMDPRAGPWRLWADRHQLENAVLNLCVNARDAMDGRGTLTIATSQATLDAGEVSGCAAGDYIRLSVRDTGHGMSQEVIERVFEPFFTTKPVGKGTGLGLSQVFGYVGHCKGGIRILSVPGEGAEVQLFLPRDPRGERQDWSDRVVDMASPATAPRQSILVVEDDPRVLASTLEALGELGHHCIGCDEPARARDLLAEYPDVKVILTDVIMPTVTGIEMVADMRAQGIALPVIFVTGYAGDVEEAAMLDGEHVLRKPFTLSQLDRIIAQAVLGRIAGTPGAPAQSGPAQPDDVAFSA
ncbi:MAG TPA: ATP-binding protein [Sphingobium sp.]|nr:ATP-binding protein [Sphingobium sp.]